MPNKTADYSFEKQIGATLYKTGVFFNPQGQTFEEKVLRLIKNDLTCSTEYSIAKMPQTDALPERSAS